MNRTKLCKAIALAILENDAKQTHMPIRGFQKEIIPGKLWVAINHDSRLPDLLIMGSEPRTGETFSFSDFIWIFDKWANQTGPFSDMDWDTDQDAWTLSFTMDLYHMARSPQRWLWDTLNTDYENGPDYPAWIMEPEDNTVWAMFAKLEDYHS